MALFLILNLYCFSHWFSGVLAKCKKTWQSDRLHLHVIKLKGDKSFWSSICCCKSALQFFQESFANGKHEWFSRLDGKLKVISLFYWKVHLMTFESLHFQHLLDNLTTASCLETRIWYFFLEISKDTFDCISFWWMLWFCQIQEIVNVLIVSFFYYKAWKVAYPTQISLEILLVTLLNLHQSCLRMETLWNIDR